ncbi:hypothetical protein ACFYT4_27235 [Streptomyces sp. NPDC004609]|uniref:hypothetical protein n=1 Tax=Streptomyces sp. NPDC004609 TaxID=3364704 RepID=UPI0036BE267E
MPVRHESRSRKPAAIIARICWITFAALLIADVSIGLPGHSLWVVLPAIPAVVLDLLNGRAARREHAARERPPAIEVAPPVTGRWIAHNSPADEVPSGDQPGARRGVRPDARRGARPM